ncbi:MAG: M48 family metallopeptidase [Pigmentiphaga sp.]|nr:M48 family metallopeptidase [Pigmentiphaga sp.]
MKKPFLSFRVSRLLLAVAAASAALTACQSVQTTGSGTIGVSRNQYMTSLVSEAQLNQQAVALYQKTLADAKSKGQLNTNAAQTQRVKTISDRLIRQVGAFRPDAASWAWEVNVITSDEVNAWCMPGGKIAVYSGLINTIKPTDAELAAVIGHEIAHALREHSREQASQQVATQMGLSVLTAITGTQLTNDLGSVLSNVMFELPNSRGHESEADLIGVELAARAGYDPRAAVTLWQKMGQLSGGSRNVEWLSTHPSPETRMAELQRAAERVMPLYNQK